MYLLSTLIASSCVSHGELLNLNQGEFSQNQQVNIPPMRIQVDDLLSIRVMALDEATAAPFNLDPGNANMAMQGAGGGRPIIGHLVDHEGFIDFPVLGRIAVEGLTTKELKEVLSRQLQTYLVNPVVNIRFINFRITITGEVSRSGSFVLPNERVTILDALGYAGDITPVGNRENVLIVREQDGVRQFGRINLHDRNLFDSPFFYMRQNDYIYVEPLPEATVAVRDQSQRILPWVSLVTTIVTLTIALTR